MLFSLSSLHDSDNYSINNVLSLNSDFLVINLLLLILVSSLLLVGLDWYELDLNVVVSESSADINLFIGYKLGFLHVLFV